MLHWLQRTGFALFATLALAPASFGDGSPEIAIEQPAGTALGLAVVAWGDNGDGQTSVPVDLTDVRAIAAGVQHTVALKGDGTVVAWGFNISGQADVPVDLTGVKAVGAGFDHTVALKNDGTVVAWGSDVQGQTSVPNGLSGVQAISVGYYHNLALKADGTVVAWGLDASGQATVPAGLTGVRAVAAGGYHSVALKADGSVVVWGDNTFNQLTVPLAAQSEVRAISAGDYHCVALKEDGTIVAWGRNDLGQTDVTAGLGGVQAIAAGGLETVALTYSGNVLSWGVMSVPAGLTRVHSIAAGGSHAVALVNPVVDFGDQIAGTSVTKTFTIKNTGSAPLNITGVNVYGDIVDDFTLTRDGMLENLPATTGTTTFTVTFRPMRSVVRTKTLLVTSDDADEGTFNITLTGTGFYPPATDDAGFTTGRKAIDIDVLANDTDLNRATAAITLPTTPRHGTVRVVGGKVRYIPDGALPLTGDTFTYQYDDGHGGIALGTVTIVNFAAIAGDYDGLIDAGIPQVALLAIEPDGAARHRQSGRLRMSLSRTGAFTGTLTFGGTLLNQIGQPNAGTYSFMGVVDSAGKMVRTIQRRGLPPIFFTLRFDAESSTITGTATSTDSTTQFTSELSLAKRTAAGLIAGDYPIQIIPDGTVGTPDGRGTANVRIRTTGNVIITGTMPDGAPFSSTAYLHADQTFPLYTILYNGNARTRGSLRGIMRLPGGIALRGAFFKDLEWFKPARPRDTLFPAGFNVSAYEQFDTLIK